MPRRPRDRYGRPLPAGSRNELAHAEIPGQVCDSGQEAVRRGIGLFEEHRFFEAHEFFEAAWKWDGVPDLERGLWKALTQIAAGCCHVQRGNPAGATALLVRACRALEPYPARMAGFEIRDLQRRLRDFAGSLDRRDPGDAPGFPRLPLTPR